MRKRALAILLSVVLLGTLAGCSKPGMSAKEQEKIKNAAIRHIENGGLIYIGMTRAEAEKVAGPVLENAGVGPDIGPQLYRGGLSLQYFDGIVGFVFVRAEDVVNEDNLAYELLPGVKIGDTRQAIADTYGNRVIPYAYGDETRFCYAVGLKYENDRWLIDEPHKRYEYDAMHERLSAEDGFKFAQIEFFGREGFIERILIRAIGDLSE